MSNIPDWVPSSVKNIAQVFPFDPDMQQRLLNNVKMQNVWDQLRKSSTQYVSDHLLKPSISQAELENLYSQQLDSVQRLDTWDVSDLGIPIQDKACAAFFISTVMICSFPRTTRTMAQANKMASEWEDASVICAWIKDDQMFSSELRSAAAVMAPGLAGHAKLLRETGQIVDYVGQASAAHVLARSSGERNNDNIRGRVRELALSTRKLAGSWLYGTVATAATVALASRKPISKKNVEDWCKDLPSQ